MRLAAKAVDYVFRGRFKHISRFSAVGAANTLVDFAVFTLCHSLIGVNYLTSQVLGYSFGIINSFILNKRWTFENNNSSKKTALELIQFIAVNLLSLAATIFIMNYMVTELNTNVYFSKIIVTVVAQITNFLGYKLWVFGSLKETRQDA